MILYDPDSLIQFVDYGIQVPQYASRASKALQALSDHPRLGPLKDQWLCNQAIEDQATIDCADLTAVHDTDFIDLAFSDAPEPALMDCYELLDAKGEFNRYTPQTAELPLKAIVQKVLRNVAGTCAASELALQHGFCFYLAGGMHHAMAGRGRGFCLLNDMVIAADRAIRWGKAKTVWIIDVDAHRGDGTARMCTGRDDILTLSVHMARGWPLDEPDLDAEGRLQEHCYPSTVDFGVPKGGEAWFLPGLQAALDLLQAAAGGTKPDLALVVAGSDPYEKDELDSAKDLKLTLDQMEERDWEVYSRLEKLGVPQAWVTSGGYGASVWEVYARGLTRILSWRLGVTP